MEVGVRGSTEATSSWLSREKKLVLTHAHAPFCNARSGLHPPPFNIGGFVPTITAKTPAFWHASLSCLPAAMPFGSAGPHLCYARCLFGRKVVRDYPIQ